MRRVSSLSTRLMPWDHDIFMESALLVQRQLHAADETAGREHEQNDDRRAEEGRQQPDAAAPEVAKSIVKWQLSHSIS